MTLLYLAIAYMLGIAVGQWLWDAAAIGCHFPNWLWLVPLMLLPLTALFHQISPFKPPAPPMRWPISAGFVPPDHTPSLGLLIALMLCVFMGVFRYASQPLTPCWTASDLAYYNASAEGAFDKRIDKVVIKGYVSSYPLVQDIEQRMYIEAQEIELADGRKIPVNGALRLSTSIRQRYDYGQSVRLYGRLVTPPELEEFNYRAYLARRQVYSLLYEANIDYLDSPNQGHRLYQMLYRLRARGEIVLNRLLPEPYAGLANGMLLGIESGIPDALYEKFNLTGTSHVIVISGSNVALISALLMSIGQRLFGKRRAMWPTLLGIGCYVLLVGGDAAVLRAGLMGGLYVVATGLDRQGTALVGLGVACWAITLFINPLTLWDVGFQLSSAATLGLILFTPGITALFGRLFPRFTGGLLTSPTGAATAKPLSDHGPSISTSAHFFSIAKGFLYTLLMEGLIVTTAANLTTLPLVVYYFGRLSAISLLTNLLISPVQPFIMLWGSAGVLVGAMGLIPLAQALLWIPWLSLVWTVAMVKSTAAIPGASLAVTGYGIVSLTATYTMLFAIHWRVPLMQRLKQFTRLFSWLTSHRQMLNKWTIMLGPTAIGLLLVVNIILWIGLRSQPDGQLHIHFLDVGQGDGILIETPSGRQVLIDGGRSPQALFGELGEVMPFWDRTLDVLVLTHPDGDHMDAQIEVPGRFQVTSALDTMVSQANPDAVPWQSMMATNGVAVAIQHRGGWIDLGDGVALWILWPPAAGYMGENVDNENSIVMKLVYGNFSVLLTGDVGIPSERALLSQGVPLASTVLKVGHHGSKYSSDLDFIQRVNPAIAVIQVGDNSYGHPSPEVLDRLGDRLILRNDQQGRVHLWSDGERMGFSVEADRPTR